MKINYEIKNVINNSFWGVISNVIQNIFLSIFFILLARNYNQKEFGYYVIANAIYSITLSFSNLGLGNWFIREIINEINRKQIIGKFLKIQLVIGLLFYILSIGISQVIYWNYTISILTIIIGSNIILDNLIYVIKSINVVDLNQNKTNLISTIESFMKLLTGILVAYKKIPMELLLIVLVIIRSMSLYIFLRMGSNEKYFLKNIIKEKVGIQEIKKVVISNWTFVVISTIAILNWRIGNLFVSKYLSLAEVGYYEISFKLLSIAYIIPIITSTTIYPHLLQTYNNSKEKMVAIYKKLHIIFFIYGIVTFTFMYSYAEEIIHLLFGNNFVLISIYCREMFTIMLFFPSVLLQANVMVAIKKEKIDMYCNIAALSVNVIICIVGLPYFKNISTVNIAIVSSFAVFHIIQDIILIKEKMVEQMYVIKFYITILLVTTIYITINNIVLVDVFFWIFWLMIAFLGFLMYNKEIKLVFVNNSN